jgi:hypothetical protein
MEPETMDIVSTLGERASWENSPSGGKEVWRSGWVEEVVDIIEGLRRLALEADDISEGRFFEDGGSCVWGG